MRERNAMQVAYSRTRGKRYAETFRCPGGALCLDFCNSGQGIRGSQEEWIPTYADLVDWLEAAGDLPESQALRLRTGGADAPQAAQQLFERAIAFRKALARVFLARLRRCGNSTCYWLFLDETKNCSRRWCEMASCGNLMKVRRHRARQRRSV